MRSFLINKMAASGLVGSPSVPAVNQTVPPLPLQPADQPEPFNADAGATAQKSMVPPVASVLPKTAQATSRIHTMQTAPRFLLHSLVQEAEKHAMERVRIAQEASSQLKQSSAEPPVESTSDEEVSTDYAMKLAAAIEYALPHIQVKMAAPNAPPPHMSETVQRPGEGPGAIQVMESNQSGSPPGPGQQGSATPKNQPPKDPPTQASNHGPANQMQNTINTPPGGTGVQTTAMPAGQGKTASDLTQSNLSVLAKMAAGEDMSMGQKALLLGLGGFGPGASGVEIGDAAIAAGKNPYAEAVKGSLRGGGESILGGLGGAVAGGLGGAGLGAGTALAGKGLAALSPKLKALGGLDPRAAAAVGGVGGAAIGGLTGDALGYRHGTNAHLQALQEQAGKEASVGNLVDGFLAYVKQAEDAINPAHISAGPAVPPDASASGEGTPSLPSGASLVGSNESAINYNKQQAKAEPKRDMGAYVSEPALSAAHDTTLQQAFAHTGQAGVKISSAQDAAMRVSASRELLSSIAEAAATK